MENRLRIKICARGCLRGFGTALAVLMVLQLPVSGVRAGESAAAGGVRVPQINDQGVRTSMLTGRQVRMHPGRPMEITDLMVYFFEEDGETVRMRIQSPFCIFDSARGRATSEEAIRVEAERFTIDGRGFEYRVAAQRIEIFSDVKVVLRNLGGDPPPPQATTP